MSPKAVFDKATKLNFISVLMCCWLMILSLFAPFNKGPDMIISSICFLIWIASRWSLDSAYSVYSMHIVLSVPPKNDLRASMEEFKKCQSNYRTELNYWYLFWCLVFVYFVLSKESQL